MTWEFILSHSSVFTKVQTETFPRRSKSTLEIPWHNFSEAQDKGQGHGQCSLRVKGQIFCQGKNTGSRVGRPWWESGFWSLPALPLGQVTWCLGAWVASEAEILIYVQWSGERMDRKVLCKPESVIQKPFIKVLITQSISPSVSQRIQSSTTKTQKNSCLQSQGVPLIVGTAWKGVWAEEERGAWNPASSQKGICALVLGPHLDLGLQLSGEWQGTWLWLLSCRVRLGYLFTCLAIHSK